MAITIADSFQLKSQAPLDTRLQYETIEQMRSEPESSLYDGILSFCVEADSLFIWKSTYALSPEFGRWTKFTGGNGSGGNGVFISTEYYEAMKSSGTLVMDKVYFVSDEFIDESEAEDKIVLNEESYQALADAGKLNDNTIYYVY